ncbi:MAG: sensor histidine kinase [bacterium]
MNLKRPKYFTGILFPILWLTITILFPSCAYLNKNTSPENSNPIIRLENWEHRWGDFPKDVNGNYIFSDYYKDSVWTKSKNIKMLNVDSPDRIVWFRIKLPELNNPAPAVFVNRAKQRMVVYLNGKMIFDNINYCPEPGKIQALESRWYMIKLPDSSSGKHIYFRFYSEDNEIGMSTPVSLGSTDTFLKKIILDNTDDMIIGSIVVIFGIFTLIVFLFSQRNRFYFGLAIYFFTSGSFLLVNNPFIYLVTDNVYLVELLDCFTLYFMSILFISVGELVLEKYKPYLTWMWRLHLAYIVFLIFAMIFLNSPVRETEDIFLILILATSNFSLFTLFKSASRERMEALILLIATIIFSGFGTAEILLFYFNYYANTWYTTTYVFQWGVLSFAVSMIVLIAYKYRKSAKEKEEAQKKVVREQQLAIEAVQREISTREKYTKQLLESQDNERKRIARELHDAIGQELLIIKNMALLSLDAKKRDSNTVKVDEYLTDISETSSSVIENVRSLSRNLHPSQLDSLGLTCSLESTIKRIADSTGIDFKYNIDNIDKLFEKENEVHIYRIIQETINNIMKHSNASEAQINISRNDGNVNILISDNGKGFSNERFLDNNMQPEGFGISGIYERVNILRGTVEFKSEKEKGLSVFINLPVVKN